MNFWSHRFPSFIKFLQRGRAVYIIPVYNPDGYELRNRHNANAIDLNHDFESLKTGGLTQPENRQWIEFLSAELKKNAMKLALSIDYHCCTGAIIFPSAIDKKNVPRFEEVGKFVQFHIDPDYDFGLSEMILGYSAHGASDHF